MIKKIFTFILFLFFTALLDASGTNLKIILKSVNENSPIPDAAIIVKSDYLMNEVESLSNDNGMAVVYDLPQGFYKITVTREGFESKIIENLKLGINDESRLVVYLRSNEEIANGQPEKDFEFISDADTSIKYSYDLGRWLGYLPILRNVINLLFLPGGVSGRESPSILGGGFMDNSFYIDGAFNTDPYTQDMGLVIGVDYLESINAYLVNIPVEYGLGTGGVLELTTLSGSNRYHGGINLLLRRNGWNDISINNPDYDGDDAREGTSGDNWTFSAGGFLLRDVAWWRLSYETKKIPQAIPRRVSPMIYNEFIVEDREPDYYTISLKGTFQISPELKGTIVYLNDYSKFYNEGARTFSGRKTMLSADRSRELNRENSRMALSYLPAESFLLEGQWSYLEYINDQKPQEGTQIDGISFISSDSWYWGAVPYLSHLKDSVETLKFSASFAVDFPVPSDIKIGFEYRNNYYELYRQFYPSGSMITTGTVESVGFDNANWEQMIVYDQAFPETENNYDIFSLFAQDSLSFGDSFTLNAGIRLDSHVMYNNLDEKVFSGGLFDAISPRIGAVFTVDDFIFRGSYSKYFDQLWMEMAYDMNITEREYKYYYTPADGSDGRNGWVLNYVASGTLNSFYNSISEELVPQNCDEFALGFDWQISDFLNLSVFGVSRIFRDLVVAEDMNTDGVLLWQNVETDAYGDKWKTWDGFVFGFRKRPSNDGFFFNADFTLSKEKNLTSSDSGYDEYLINPVRRKDNAGDWWGVSEGPTLQLSMQSFYIFPNNWYLGLTVDWNNGALYTTRGTIYVDGFGKYVFYPNGRGDIDRLPDAFQMNLQFGVVTHFELPFTADFLGSEATFEVLIKINNITSNEYPMAVVVSDASADYLNFIDWNRARWYQLGINISM